MGIRDKPTAPAPPWQNGIAERLIGSIRRECVAHFIVLGEAHLRRVLRSYSGYYNDIRTHWSLDKDAPVSRKHATICLPNELVIRGSTDQVTSDNAKGAADVADYVVQADRKRIALIEGAPLASTIRARQTSFSPNGILAQDRIRCGVLPVGSRAAAGCPAPCNARE